MGKSLLLVDDEKNILRSLRRLLERDGYDVHTASSGYEALSVLITQPIPVVISDHMMPEVSGVDLVSRIRKFFPETVSLMLTGNRDISCLKDAVNEGYIYKFLQKPWDEEELLRSVADAFEFHDESTQKTKELAEIGRSKELLTNARLNDSLQLEHHKKSSIFQSHILESMPVGILVFDDQGIVLHANASIRSIFGKLITNNVNIAECLSDDLLEVLEQLKELPKFSSKLYTINSKECRLFCNKLSHENSCFIMSVVKMA